MTAEENNYFFIIHFFQFFEAGFCEPQLASDLHVTKDALELHVKSTGITGAHRHTYFMQCGGAILVTLLTAGAVHLTRRKLSEKGLLLAHSLKASFHHVGEDMAVGPRG